MIVDEYTNNSTDDKNVHRNKTLVLAFKKRSKTIARWSCCLAPQPVGLIKILNTILPSIKANFWCSDAYVSLSYFEMQAQKKIIVSWIFGYL